MSQINRLKLNNSSNYVELGDVRYFGSMDYWQPEVKNTTELKWQPWMSKISSASKLTGILEGAGSILCLMLLGNEYDIFRTRNKKEPDWISKLPQKKSTVSA